MAFLARESGEVDFASQDAKDGEGLRTACKMGKFFPLKAPLRHLLRKRHLSRNAGEE